MNIFMGSNKTILKLKTLGRFFNNKYLFYLGGLDMGSNKTISKMKRLRRVFNKKYSSIHARYGQIKMENRLLTTPIRGNKRETGLLSTEY
jgi:hypothetical protein